MIKKVVIRDVASFDDRGVTFADLQKVNIIYGGNGAGKTTISRVLEYGYQPKGYRLPTGMTMVKPWIYPTCEVDWDGAPMKVLVYNKDFKEKCFMESIPGVFIPGIKSIEDEAHRAICFNPLQSFGCFVVLDSKTSVEKAKEDYDRLEQYLYNVLWEEFYQPNRGQREFMKGYNKKKTFAGRIRLMLKRKREGDLLWALDGNEKDKFWKELALKSEYLVERVEAELEHLNESIRHCENLYDLAVEEEWKELTGQKGDDTFYSFKPNLTSINETLKLYKYTGFSIQPSSKNSNAFQIQREDGTFVGDTLSEGEATIISFLYFLQIVDGFLLDEKSNEPKVVVIDDPISSLDYNSIDLVSTLTNDLIKKARKEEGGLAQVIVLTHNTSYHKCLSVNQPRNNTHYWELIKENGKSRLNAYEKTNPVRGDYYELWVKLQEVNDDEVNSRMQNLMRRILDAYFLAFGGYDRNKLYAGEYIKNTKVKRDVESLTKWLGEENSSQVDREKRMAQFRMLFEAMGHIEHYKMMMKGEIDR